MGTLIRLLITALVLHATFRAGEVYWRYYQFKDGSEQIAQFAGNLGEQELRERVMALARVHAIPLAEDRVSIRRADNHTYIDAAYTEDVELVPRYRYPWELRVQVDAFTIVAKDVR